MSGQHGLTPYGLQPPARLLMPGSGPAYHGLQTRIVTLGSGSDAATLEVRTWDKCSGCSTHVLGHEAGRTVYLKVPCEALPHCSACECGSSHDFLLADEQVTELLAALS